MAIVPNGRASRFALVALCFAVCAAIARPAAAEDIMTSVSDKHMESVFDAMGLIYTKKKDHAWKVALGSHKALIQLANDNTDLQFYAAFGDVTVTPDRMNAWNKAKRFSRAYADDDKNPVVEQDVDFAGGITDETLKAAIKLFQSTVDSFVKFLNE